MPWGKYHQLRDVASAVLKVNILISICSLGEHMLMFKAQTWAFHIPDLSLRYKAAGKSFTLANLWRDVAEMF